MSWKRESESERERERQKAKESEREKEKWNEDIGKKAEKMRDKEIEANVRIPSELSSAFCCLIFVFSAHVMALSL